MLSDEESSMNLGRRKSGQNEIETESETETETEAEAETDKKT